MGLLLLLGISLPGHTAPLIIPAPPTIPAKGYLLVDYDSGRVLVSEKADERMEPASITKMMTTYIISSELRNGNIKLDDKVRISEKAWRAPGSRMFVEVNTDVSVEDLLRGIIVQSGNDATIALAEYVSGTEQAFVSTMNQYAKMLGMKNTHFVNSTGLPHKDHYSSATDLATLARAMIRNFPEHYAWYAEKEFTYNKIKQYNRNRLLWRDKSVDGIKTGHTESAGYCLVASARRNNMRLISVVLGATSQSAREKATLTLLNYGFRFYETQKLHSGSSTLVSSDLWKSESDSIAMGLKDDLYITSPRGQFKRIKTTIRYDSYIIAPINKGQRLGTVTLTLAGKEIATRPLVALHDAKEGSLWSTIIDTIKLFFIKLFS